MGQYPFRRLQADLANLISSLPAESRLPSEPELARRMGVSRATLREAMRSFEGQGMIRRRQGVGTFVVAKVPVLDTGLEVLESIETLAERTNLSVNMGELQVQQVEADAEASRGLERPGRHMPDAGSAGHLYGKPPDCLPGGHLAGGYPDQRRRSNPGSPVRSWTCCCSAATRNLSNPERISGLLGPARKLHEPCRSSVMMYCFTLWHSSIRTMAVWWTIRSVISCLAISASMSSERSVSNEESRE